MSVQQNRRRRRRRRQCRRHRKETSAVAFDLANLLTRNIPPSEVVPSPLLLPPKPPIPRPLLLPLLPLPLLRNSAPRLLRLRGGSSESPTSTRGSCRSSCSPCSGRRWPSRSAARTATSPEEATRRSSTSRRGSTLFPPARPPSGRGRS